MVDKLPVKALITAIIISFIGTLSTYFLSVRVGDELKVERQLKLQNIAKQISIRFQDAINMSQNDLQALQAFYSVKTEDKFQDEFNHYMQLLNIEKRSYIQALSWVPLVEGSQRQHFEQNVRKQQSNFNIKQQGPEGGLVVSPIKPYYTPVTYISPYDINQKAQGFDLSSNSTRRASLEYARDTGKMTTTAKIKLVQEEGDSYGFLIIAPVYKQGANPITQQARRNTLLGYVTGVYRINTLMSSAQKQASQEGLILTLTDLDKSNGGLLYGSKNADQTITFDLSVPDRKWQLGISLNETLKKNIESPRIIYSILVIGTLGSFLLALAIYALQTSHRKSLKIVALSKSLTFQNKELEQIVEDRTKALEKTNDELNVSVEELKLQRKVLSHSIIDSQRAKATVEQHAKELARSNKDLDEFAYVASHDLKAPLRGIDLLASWVTEDIKEGNLDDVLSNLGLMRNRVQRLESLLNDLLTYSRVNRQNHSLAEINSNQVVNELFTLISPPSGFTVELETPLPTFITARTPFELIIMNLLNNAVKHHDKSEGRISVACDDKKHDEFYLFKVQDDGPGIEPAYYDAIFQMFKTLKPRDEVEGSGMGLALIKKIVEHYNGEVYVESTINKGSSFFFTWPKKIQAV